MAHQQTTKQQYEELIADLKAGTHTTPDKQRPVLSWDEYDVPADLTRPVHVPEQDGRPARTIQDPHPHAGRHVVTVQYGGPSGGDGGLLRDYAFNPADLVEPEPEPEKEPEKAPDKTDKTDKKTA
jgi:hypothetical protein